MICQNLQTDWRQFRAVLLQAGKHREVISIHHRLAEPCNVARARLLFIRGSTAIWLLRKRRGDDEPEGQTQSNASLQHYSPFAVLAIPPSE